MNAHRGMRESALIGVLSTVGSGKRDRSALLRRVPSDLRPVAAT